MPNYGFVDQIEADFNKALRGNFKVPTIKSAKSSGCKTDSGFPSVKFNSLDMSDAIVEGVNVVSKSQKPNAKNPQGGIVKMEAPIHISNLNVVDPKSGKPTRIGRRLNEEGKLVRYAKKSGEEIK